MPPESANHRRAGAAAASWIIRASQAGVPATHAPSPVNVSFDLMFGSLTLLIAGGVLAIAPRGRRVEFLLHIAIVTGLTLYIVKIGG